MAGSKVYYAKEYHPIQAGSIDGMDYIPHDHAVQRALLASSFYDPTADPKAVGDPYCTIFVGQLSRDTSEETLHKTMSQYGKVRSLRLVRHIVTGASRGYAFVEFENERDYLHAYEKAHHITIDGKQIIVDYNRQQLMPGWIPRRLGGGLGGRKESGQLRFGGRERPFRAPFMNAIRKEELEKHGIPLPSPDRLVSRYQIPPPPKRPRKEDNRDDEEGEPRSHSRRHEGDGKRHHRRRREDGSRKQEEGGRYDRQEDRDRRRSRREEEEQQHSGRKHGDAGNTRHRSSQDRYGDDAGSSRHRSSLDRYSDDAGSSRHRSSLDRYGDDEDSTKRRRHDR